MRSLGCKTQSGDKGWYFKTLTTERPFTYVAHAYPLLNPDSVRHGADEGVSRLWVAPPPKSWFNCSIMTRTTAPLCLFLGLCLWIGGAFASSGSAEIDLMDDGEVTAALREVKLKISDCGCWGWGDDRRKKGSFVEVLETRNEGDRACKSGSRLFVKLKNKANRRLYVVKCGQDLDEWDCGAWGLKPGETAPWNGCGTTLSIDAIGVDRSWCDVRCPTLMSRRCLLENAKFQVHSKQKCLGILNWRRTIDYGPATGESEGEKKSGQ